MPDLSTMTLQKRTVSIRLEGRCRKRQLPMGESLNGIFNIVGSFGNA